MIITYADGSQEAKSSRLHRVLPILACPICLGPLAKQDAWLICQNCDARHPIKGDVPVLLPAGVQDAGAMLLSDEDRVSRHPYSLRAEEIIAAHPLGWVLDLGAGGKLDRRENVVQIDIFRYPAVDVVGSADCLPFCDNAFDAVISQAVFEHLQYPEWAVREIRRVLKAGGVAKIDTAFLQPEHGYPHHFYNATETGLLHWFRDFEIQWSGVEPFQHPKWAMHWFLGVYLDFVGQQQAKVLRQLQVGALVDVLQRHATQQTTPSDSEVIKALDALPEHFLRVLAAGVSLHAVNPAKHEITLNTGSDQHAFSLDREREMARLRAEKSLLVSQLQLLQDRLTATQDKAEYLVQFYPMASGLAQFAAEWVDPSESRQIVVNANSSALSGDWRPFASVVVHPTAISPLMDTFFSLTNQQFGGWELLLVIGGEQPAGVKRAANALCRLDRRVVIVSDDLGLNEANIADWPTLRGEYWMHLPQGATLVFDALQEVISVARNLPGTQVIEYDFDRGTAGSEDRVRCYTHAINGVVEWESVHTEFAPRFVRVERNCEPQEEVTARVEGYAHIPRLLVNLNLAAPEDFVSLRASLQYLLEQYQTVAKALRQDASLMQQRLKVAEDKAEYLAQFYPSACNAAQFAAAWADPQHFRQIGPGLSGPDPFDESGPFASFVVRPTEISPLMDTFFSLTNQEFGGWELLLVVEKEMSAGVKRAANALCRLDRRVVIVSGGARLQDARITDGLVARGEYWMWLPSGAAVAFNALQEAITVARHLPGTRTIEFDFERTIAGTSERMRCYTAMPDGATEWVVEPTVFVPRFVKVRNSGRTEESLTETELHAHIPYPLVCLNPELSQELVSLKASIHYLLEQNSELDAELQQINVESPNAARELRQLNLDVANYLTRYYFDQMPVKRSTIKEVGVFRWMRQAMGRWVRMNLPHATLPLVRKARAALKGSRQEVQLRAAESRPFVSFVLEPNDAIALISTFFSLVHQSYSGWELLLIETEEQSPAVRRAMHDFCELDSRVVIVRASSDAESRLKQLQLTLRGDYFLMLIDGITAAFDAVELVVTLAKASPSTQAVVCDFDGLASVARLPMRCYNSLHTTLLASSSGDNRFDGIFVLTAAIAHRLTDESVANIPICLFHRTLRTREVSTI